VNNLRSSETDISLSILNGLNSYLNHFDLSNIDEMKLPIISKSFEEIILCLAKSMRNQDEKNRIILSDYSLIICCLSSNILLTNNKLWLKFLYFIFDKQTKQIEIYFQNNINSLIEICTTNQRLQKVIIEYSLFLVIFIYLFLGTNISYKSFMFNKTKFILKIIFTNCLSTFGTRSIFISK
jgi:hypothetical protein